MGDIGGQRRRYEVLPAAATSDPDGATEGAGDEPREGEPGSRRARRFPERPHRNWLTRTGRGAVH